MRINKFIQYCSATLYIMMAFCVSAQAGNKHVVTIKNGVLWTDTDGKTVQAHGGNIIQVGKMWYLIGEDRSDSWNPDVNLYSSENLRDWKFEGKILENKVTHPALGRSRMIERPKLMYNKQTEKFVIWCHWESKNYGASEAGVFESSNVQGPYNTVWTGRPLGTKSRDCNIFVDNDGTAYFISTTDENTNLGLFELSPDYRQAISKTVLCEGMRREAPAIVNIDGTYHMISSACTGWDPNQALITTSKNLKEGWSPMRKIGDRIAFDTQASSILTIKGTKGTTYIYVGDRWMDPDLPNSKIIMLPIEFENGEMVLRYREQWQLDLKRGTWRDLD